MFQLEFLCYLVTNRFSLSSNFLAGQVNMTFYKFSFRLKIFCILDNKQRQRRDARRGESNIFRLICILVIPEIVSLYFRNHKQIKYTLNSQLLAIDP